ncbi:hypothetical protein R0J90_24090, partial [Micrococcus sp. SIMBA_144]
LELTLADYGVGPGQYDLTVGCDQGGCGTLEPGEVGFVPPLPPSGAALAAEEAAEQDAPEVGTPVRIRQKAFPATPM